MTQYVNQDPSIPDIEGATSNGAPIAPPIQTGPPYDLVLMLAANPDQYAYASYKVKEGHAHGKPVAAICKEFGITEEQCYELLDYPGASYQGPKAITPQVRRDIIGARLNLCTSRLLPLIERGDQQAMKLYLEIARSEAKLYGLNIAMAPSTVHEVPVIQVSWIQPGRLSYRKTMEESTNVTDIADARKDQSSTER